VPSNSKESLAVLILAAGQGKRMGQAAPKVVIKTREKPLILHVLETVSKLNPERVVVVTGHQRETVEQVVKDGAKNTSGKENYSLKNIFFSFQKEQLGTGDAVKSALSNLGDFVGSVLILYGDVPLVKPQTLEKFIKFHSAENATLSLISFRVNKENQYGRIVRDKSGKFVQKIVEFRDCSPSELKIEEVNSGLYLVDSSFLKPAIEGLKNENAQKEYYLTDILEHASREGQTISALVLEDSEEVLGVNNFYDLSLVNRALRMRKTAELIDKGILLEHPESVIVDTSAEIESGVRIGPNVQILGNSKIARGVHIEGTAYIKNCVIGENSVVKLGVRMEEATLGKDCAVGPFANLRPKTLLDDKVKIGNFVETKKAHLKEGAKASHLTYLGDCTVGKESNIGAGTITCNYDGYAKFPTDIGAGVFIGSNTSLVAPVTIEDGATVGAGSVITKRVEKDSLAFTRAPQLTKAGWSKKKREKNS